MELGGEQMKLRIRLAWCLSVAACWLLAGAAAAQNGIILDQYLNGSNQGYTVIRVWGSHYEMGDAQAHFLGDYIVDAVNETKTLTGVFYDTLRGSMAASVWRPAELEDELDGMVAALAISHPSAGIDKVDLKVMNTYGDWGYACRSHICWGRYVAPPIKTLATRRLDFGSPMPTASTTTPMEPSIRAAVPGESPPIRAARTSWISPSATPRWSAMTAPTTMEMGASISIPRPPPIPVTSRRFRPARETPAAGTPSGAPRAPSVRTASTTTATGPWTTTRVSPATASQTAPDPIPSATSPTATARRAAAETAAWGSSCSVSCPC